MIKRRRIRVTIETATGERIVVNPGNLEPQLEVDFSIGLSLTPESNRASVRITNLGPATRKAIAGVVKRDVDVRAAKLDLLDAGFVSAQNAPDVIRTSTINSGDAFVQIEAGWGEIIPIVFSGSCQRARHYKQGAEWYTELEIADGLATMMRSVARKEFPPNSHLFDVIDHFRKCMGLGPGNVTKAKLEAIAGGGILLLPFGYSAIDEARYQTTAFLQPLGITWFVDRGEMFIMRENESLPAAPVPLNYETGLIENPQLGENGTLQVAMLMNTDVRPGVRVAITGVELSGVYRCDSVRHRMSNKTGLTMSEAIVRQV